MKFVDRTRETASLQAIQKQSLEHAQFTVLTGRRRIGKTSLVFHAYKDLPFLYFFVSKKSESELCTAYQQEISTKLGIPMLGRVTRFDRNSNLSRCSLMSSKNSCVSTPRFIAICSGFGI